MCLGTKLSDRSLARYKAKGKKKGYIRVWKTVIDTGSYYRGWWMSDHKYKKGLNHARKDATHADMLHHAFVDRNSANTWASEEVVLQCYVSLEWIKEIGKAQRNGKAMKTLTTKAIVMPAYPKRKVTVAEFRKAIKGKKVKTYSWEN